MGFTLKNKENQFRNYEPLRTTNPDDSLYGSNDVTVTRQTYYTGETETYGSSVVDRGEDQAVPSGSTNVTSGFTYVPYVERPGAVTEDPAVTPSTPTNFSMPGYTQSELDSLRAKLEAAKEIAGNTVTQELTSVPDEFIDPDTGRLIEGTTYFDIAGIERGKTNDDFGVTQAGILPKLNATTALVAGGILLFVIIASNIKKFK